MHIFDMPTQITLIANRVFHKSWLPHTAPSLAPAPAVPIAPYNYQRAKRV